MNITNCALDHFIFELYSCNKCEEENYCDGKISVACPSLDDHKFENCSNGLLVKCENGYFVNVGDDLARNCVSCPVYNNYFKTICEGYENITCQIDDGVEITMAMSNIVDD